MTELLDNVVFEDSYLLGWKCVNGNAVHVFLQLLVGPTHPWFRGFDEDKEYGCYRLATMTFVGVSKGEGLTPREVAPRWNSKLAEFGDVDEINSASVDPHHAKFDCDDRTIVLSYKSFALQLVAKEHRGSFRPWLAES